MKQRYTEADGFFSGTRRVTMNTRVTLDQSDLSEHIEPGELPCCPLCDNEILEYAPACIVTAHGGKALAHDGCVENAQ